MLNKEQKIKLIIFYNNGLITKEQLQLIVEQGFPMPILFEFENRKLSEHEKKLKSVMPIYERLGQELVGINFKIVPNDN